MISNTKAKRIEAISYEEALRLSKLPNEDILELLSQAYKVKREHLGTKINICGSEYIITSKCSEDCKFCPLSGHYNTDLDTNRMSVEQILASAKEKEQIGVNNFKIVITGRNIKNQKDFDFIVKVVRGIKEETNLFLCASLGCLLNEEEAYVLAEAGVDQYNHNLETSRDYFENIVTTHTYEDKIKTIQYAKKAGMKICGGGIIGLGESMEQRISLAFTLKELEIDSMPFNTLVHCPGTPLEKIKPVHPIELLKVLAIFRLILPNTHIVLGAGAKGNFRDLESLALLACADGLLTSGYLSTKPLQQSFKQNISMIEDITYKP